MVLGSVYISIVEKAFLPINNSIYVLTDRFAILQLLHSLYNTSIVINYVCVQ